MSKLTDRQAEVLGYIVQTLEQHGRPPTRADIAEHFGFRVRSSAEDQLRKLERRGYIELLPESRGIRLLQPALALFPRPYELPLIGAIAAGEPILAEVNVEARIPIDPALFRPRAHFLHRVAGHSMQDADILDGDLVGIHAQPEASNGQIVAAAITDGTGEERITLKRYVRRGNRVILRPENTGYQPIEVDLAALGPDSQEPAPFRIAGIFAGLLRTPR